MLTEREQLADELTGFMFKKADSDDDNTWLESKDFHSVADQILSYLQSKDLIKCQLNKHNVSGQSEQLPPDELYSIALKWYKRGALDAVEPGTLFEDGIEGDFHSAYAKQIMGGNCH